MKLNKIIPVNLTILADVVNSIPGVFFDEKASIADNNRLCVFFHSWEGSKQEFGGSIVTSGNNSKLIVVTIESAWREFKISDIDLIRTFFSSELKNKGFMLAWVPR